MKAGGILNIMRGLVALPNSKKEKETVFDARFLKAQKMCLGFPTLILPERVLFSFGKKIKKCQVSQSLLWKCSLDLDLHVNSSHRTQ